MTKTPEEIIAEFEERFVVEIDFPGIFALNNPLPEDVKSFLTESLAAYRLSVLSECEGLVGERDECPMAKQHNCRDALYCAGYNDAIANWRSKISALKGK